MSTEKQPVSQTVNIMDVLQSKQFESDIITHLKKLDVNDAARIRKFHYGKVGIWNAAAVATEYRKILTKTSEEPSTVRRIITTVGKAALSDTFTRMEEALKAKAVLVAKTPKKRATKKKEVAS